jgi:hypothetical protein
MLTCYLSREGNGWILKTSKKPFRACVLPPCFQGRVSPLPDLPAGEAASLAPVAIRRRSPGSPGEEHLNPAQVAPKKRRKNPGRAAEAEPSPVQVAPKKKRRNPARAAEAEPKSSAVCTAGFESLLLIALAFQATDNQTPPSGGFKQEPR